MSVTLLVTCLYTVVWIDREVRQSMDSLKFVCSWKGNIQGAKLCVRVDGIQLEGCTFDGTRLSENQRDSPSFSQIPPCVVAWIPKVLLLLAMTACRVYYF